MDPDAPEEDEENEVEDAEGDQEETDLLWGKTKGGLPEGFEMEN